MSRRKIILALKDITAAATISALSLRSYSSAAIGFYSDCGEGITREGVNKCTRNRRHKRKGRK